LLFVNLNPELFTEGHLIREGNSQELKSRRPSSVPRE
jgi:hypothetical protein